MVSIIKKIIEKIINFYFRLSAQVQKIRYNYILSLPSKKRNNAFDLYLEEEQISSYNHFKKYFKNAIFLDFPKILEYSIKETLNLNLDKSNYYLEFGVFKGYSINLLSKYVSKIYGFDSFEGLREDWKGWTDSAKTFDLDGTIPKVNSNIFLIKGWVQDTLDEFLKKNESKINFVHLDLDTYESTKYVLEKIKPRLEENSILIFNQFYNFPGWSSGEYKAFSETFDENEYDYIAFGLRTTHVVVKIKNTK